MAGVRAFGKEGEAIIAQAVAAELETQAERHDLTEEFLKSQVTINGVVVTSKFGTYDMAAEFGISRPTQALTPATLLADMRSAMNKSKAALTTSGRTGGYVALVSNTMFESILTSDDVKTAYQYSQASGNPLRNELGTVANGYNIFSFGNIDFILYGDQFTNKSGVTTAVLAEGAGVLVPRTTLGRIFYGPASTLSGLGTAGSKRFARTFRDPKDRFVEVESETSMLVIAENFASTVALTIGT